LEGRYLKLGPIAKRIGKNEENSLSHATESTIRNLAEQPAKTQIPK
jgi:hypothetical protein